jgi:hypothetical protein
MKTTKAGNPLLTPTELETIRFSVAMAPDWPNDVRCLQILTPNEKAL